MLTETKMQFISPSDRNIGYASLFNQAQDNSTKVVERKIAIKQF
jgi:hypothetical protein